MNMFRTLRADEIVCKVKQVTDYDVLLLLYKDSRVDMNILDETVTPFCWQRTHEVINDNLFCTVSIYDGAQWIHKQDVGVESNTEKEKGESSDSFKRACFNWGIGRELYTSPVIKVKTQPGEVDNKKLKFGIKFKLKEIEYDEHRRIKTVVIVDQTGKERYVFGRSNKPVEATKPQTLADVPDKKENATQVNSGPVASISEAQIKRLYAIAKKKGRTGDQVNAAIKAKYKVEHVNQIGKSDYDAVVKLYESMPDFVAEKEV